LRVEGVDAQALERLREFVTVLPERTRVNANTAAAEVLAAQVPGLGVSDARRIAAGRDSAYFRDLAEVRARLAQAGVPANDAELAVATRYFSVEGMVTYGGARLRARALLKREAGGAPPQMLTLKELE
jgi:general secretion pathway protein K